MCIYIIYIPVYRIKWHITFRLSFFCPRSRVSSLELSRVSTLSRENICTDQEEFKYRYVRHRSVSILDRTIEYSSTRVPYVCFTSTMRHEACFIVLPSFPTRGKGFLTVIYIYKHAPLCLHLYPALNMAGFQRRQATIEL